LRRYSATQVGDVRKLEGEQDRYRLRVGEHRVIFRHEQGRFIIVVLRVGHRRDVYRR
jgi:mRNA interferase RelE/StbE